MPCYKDEKLGTWYCQFYYTDFTGVKKQKRKRGFKTRREALEWEREFQLKKSKNCDMTLSSFVDLYFADMKGRLRDSTIDNKRQIFDTKIIPYLGKRKMDEITAMDIREWQKTVKKAGEDTGLPYAETYLLTIHSQLNALFSYAQKMYQLPKNPCSIAGPMGSSVTEEMLIITKDQYDILRKHFRNEAYLLAFDVLFWSGCREGEMLALQPIPHWLAEEFRSYCSKLYGLTPDERVFYMTCTSLNKELTRCTRITSLPDIRVHDLRHSHASLCIELGYSALLVAKRLGDTVPVVMKTYAHLYPNKQAELVSKLEDLAAPENEDSGYLGSL